MNVELPLTGHPYTVFWGDPMKGKTHTACHCVYAALAKKPGTTAVFVNVENMLSELHQAVSDGKGPMVVLKELLECDYLVFDDYLCTDRQCREPAIGRAMEVLRHRADRNRVTLITTMYGPKGIEKSLPKKLSARLINPEYARAIEFPIGSTDKRHLGPLWITSRSPEDQYVYEAQARIEHDKKRRGPPKLDDIFFMGLRSDRKIYFDKIVGSLSLEDYEFFREKWLAFEAEFDRKTKAYEAKQKQAEKFFNERLNQTRPLC